MTRRSATCHRAARVFAVAPNPLAHGALQCAALAADIDSFVTQLLDPLWNYSRNCGVCLQLPEQARELDSGVSSDWERVQLLLLAPAALQAAPAVAPHHVRFQIPDAGDLEPLCTSYVDGYNVAYARHQAAVREDEHQRSALQAAADAGSVAAAAALAALPDQASDYDDDAAMEARYAELRAADMRRQCPTF